MALATVEADEAKHRQDLIESGDGVVIEYNRDDAADDSEPEDEPDHDGDDHGTGPGGGDRGV